MKIHRTRRGGIHSSLNPEQRASQAQSWRTWHTKDPVRARWAFVYLREFERDLRVGGMALALNQRAKHVEKLPRALKRPRHLSARPA